jgi:hypothetical protein
MHASVAAHVQHDALRRRTEQHAVAHDEVERLIRLPDIEVIRVDAGDGVRASRHRRDRFTGRDEPVTRDDAAETHARFARIDRDDLHHQGPRDRREVVGRAADTGGDRVLRQRLRNDAREGRGRREGRRQHGSDHGVGRASGTGVGAPVGGTIVGGAALL